MKRILLLFLCALFLSLTVPPSPAQGAVNSWQRGLSLHPRWDTDYGSDSFKQSVRDASTKVNYITLIVPLVQSNTGSTDVGTAWNTPTDASLISGIQFVHSLGLKVNLKPHLDTHDGQWRANINPGDRTSWFLAYGNMVKKYARLAKDHGVAEFTVGSELINMAADDANSTNTANWNKLIGEIRAIYSGKLTYSSNWGYPGWTDEKNRIKFWNNLDYIGISAYFPLPTGDSSVEAYKNEWHKINTQDIAPLQQRFQKPILFTEVGYRSHDWAQYEPFNFWAGGNYSGENQAKLYDALYSYWNDYPYMQGVHWWDWSTHPDAGGNGNIDYTVQNKPAENILAKWHTASPTPTPTTTPTPTPTPTPPPSSASFVGTATIPANGTPGQEQRFSVEVKNTTGSSVSNMIFDVEIYDASGAKKYQKYQDGQNFANNETKTWAYAWTPPSAGTYTVKIGVFSYDWSKNYYWNNEAGKTTIGLATSPPPSPTPAPTSIQIWWPSDGSWISGEQPFQALLEGRSLNEYKMYWQVDRGALLEMGNSNRDWPHKESIVNVDHWNWRHSGPYSLNFVAKDLSGNTIAQKESIVYVAHY